jgi:hypothetical protein
MSGLLLHPPPLSYNKAHLLFHTTENSIMDYSSEYDDDVDIQQDLLVPFDVALAPGKSYHR